MKEALVIQIAEFLANEGVVEICVANAVDYDDPVQVRSTSKDVVSADPANN